jgi:hypothetical protein
VGEYLSEDLLLTLPHRQFVWTIPKVLRVFLRHDRELFAELSRLLFDILRRFFCQAAGRSLRCAMVSSHQTFGEFGVWHPHWHTIVLEGGFDRHDTFFYIPLGATAALTEIWRRSVVALFRENGLLNPDFACKILAWQHSGFSIESGTRILDQPTREALCQYLVRAPLSLQRIRWDEQQDTVTWSASPSGFFKGKIRRYSSLDFIAQVTLHVPPRGKHLVRRYGLYSSRGRGTWKDRPALRSRAPARWYGRTASAEPTLPGAANDHEVDALCRRRAWARLLAKVHAIDVLACPKCGSRMSVITVITDPAQIRRIIACLEAGRPRHVSPHRARPLRPQHVYPCTLQLIRMQIGLPLWLPPRRSRRFLPCDMPRIAW